MTGVTGTVSSTTGSSSWTNPNNIFTSNNVYAVTTNPVSNLNLTGYIYALGNGFSIPSGATIDGIEVSIEAKNQLSATGFRVRSGANDLNLLYSGSVISGSFAPSTQTWTGNTDQTKIIGSSSDLWGCVLTPSVINDASFGIRTRFQNTNATTQTFSIDRIAITVYYTDSSGVQNSQQQFFMYEF